MNFVNTIFPESLTNAIGWTIINSLWEGFVIALILFSILSFIPDNKSRIRYNLSVAALCFFIMVTIVNLTVELATNTGISETALNAIQNKYILNEVNTADKPAGSTSLELVLITMMGTVGLYLKSNISFVVTIWLAGTLFFVTRFFGGFSYIKRMKYQDSDFVPAKWQNKLNSFRYKIKLIKPVRLLESARVNVPVVIGYIKPVILVPVGMLTGFPAKEIEAILAHELAHVARNDYLVNILQSVAEIIFFYNPALWWISSTIRKEREKCCDDMAVSLCGDSLTFAKALANLEQINTRKYQLALAISGKKNLVTRIKRLFNRKKGTTMIEKTFAAGLIGLMILSAAVFASTLNADKILSFETQFQAENSSGTESLTNKAIEEKLINEIDESINKEIDEKHVNEIDEKMPTGLSKTLITIEPGIALLDKTPGTKSIDDTTDHSGTRINYDDLTPEEKKSLKKEFEKMKIEEKKMRKDEQKMKMQEEKMREQEKEMRIKEAKMREYEEQMRVQEKKMRKQEEQMKIQEEKMHKQEEKMRIEEAKMREQEEQMKIEEKKMRKQEEKMKKIEAKFMSELTGLLVRKGIIGEGEDFSLKLNQNELYVNGNKQSDGLHQKVKQLYEKVRGSEMTDSSSFEITQKINN